MNNLRILTVGCTIAFSMSSLDTLAASTRAEGLNACAEAIVTAFGSSQGSPVDFSLSTDSDLTSENLNRRETYHLDLRSPKTDTIVARADCVVDHNAKVRRVTDVPIDARDAEERAKVASY